MAKFTDTQRINALEKHLWFVEPQYHDGGYRVGKANMHGTLQHHGRTLREAIDKALRAESIAPASNTENPDG